MKNLLILFVITVFSSPLNAQYLNSLGLSATCKCQLYEDTVYKGMQANQPTPGYSVIDAYICAWNETSYETGTIYNIIAYRFDDPSMKYNFLNSYKSEMESMGLDPSYSYVNGIKAVEYNYFQYEMPTKAAVFTKNGNWYMLITASRDNLDGKFQRFKSSIKM